MKLLPVLLLSPILLLASADLIITDLPTDLVSIDSYDDALVISAGSCIYLFDYGGNELQRRCGGDVAYGVWASDNGAVGILRKNTFYSGLGAPTWAIIISPSSTTNLTLGYTWDDYLSVALVSKSSLVLCGSNCTRYDNGTGAWNVEVSKLYREPHRIGLADDLLLVPSYTQEAILALNASDGTLVYKAPISVSNWSEVEGLSADVCGYLVAVVVKGRSLIGSLHVYEVKNNLTLLWKADRFITNNYGSFLDYLKDVAISPDCDYIAVLDDFSRNIYVFKASSEPYALIEFDDNKYSITIFDDYGNIVSKESGNLPGDLLSSAALTWSKDGLLIALKFDENGSAKGGVLRIVLDSVAPSTQTHYLDTTTSGSHAGIPTVSLLALLIPLARKLRRSGGDSSYHRSS
ncbi:hypothetical protein IPA_08390 [Ignicoccus pacificus DSM 13166]|uniref:Uncharacterized protein n=1 Tax=Ignicoccus pacificus DSM 13166 TaxID=940294 RepID=A0A977KBZ7_9CREN|nr:hypothetical protein IPA_08390 [Ignicoccus pacificus DSM 13166]